MITTTRELAASGMTRADQRRLLRTGAIERLRPGWFCTPETPAEVRLAVACGGSLTCIAALRVHGIWTLSNAVHVRIPPHGRVHRTAAPLHYVSGISFHGVDDLATAFRAARLCVSDEEMVCAIDSARNLHLLSDTELAAAVGRRLMDRSDGRSESGLETLARLRLRSLRLQVRIQVPIAGVGRVDLVVGERLVIELDGDAWHSSPEHREKDRRRDSQLVARGYLVMRAGYGRVTEDWDGFAAEVLAVVRRRDHRWRAVHRAGTIGVMASLRP